MWEKLSLEAVSTKLDTIQSILKLERCLKFRNDFNFAVFMVLTSTFNGIFDKKQVNLSSKACNFTAIEIVVYISWVC